MNNYVDIPAVAKLAEKKEMVWINPYKLPIAEAEKYMSITDEQIIDCEKRLKRFAPFIMACFPETVPTNGVIESPLTWIPNMQKALAEQYNAEILGKLLIKQDSHLAIAGSIKARGGIYEVLKHAEDLAIEHGMLSLQDNYEKMNSPMFKEFFSNYTVQVGSTGNLGLSIGISSAAIGFKVIVHMSTEAKQWKKDMLRSKGVTVIEYETDYNQAVAQGRANSDKDPNSYFVDDEHSVNLFLGYAIAAKRLKAQLDEKNVVIDGKHPLIVYLPCGVGGAPGGVAYGLKKVFGDNVHCFFVEPTMAPCMLMGMATQKHEKVSVKDIGISGVTHADGLAVCVPSGLVGRLMTPLLSGEFTVEDAKLYDYLRVLDKSENIFIEPSSCAAFGGVVNLMKYSDSKKYIEEVIGKNIDNSYQIAWATGGSLVPQEDRKTFLNTYL